MGISEILNLFLIKQEAVRPAKAIFTTVIILTKSGKIIDFQTTAEGEPYDFTQMIELFNIAKSGIDKIIGMY